MEIETHADTVCASAAARAVAFGPVGRRFAHALTKLHFHNPRVISSGPSTVQEQHAEEFVRALKASRNRMHSRLKAHLIDSLGRTGFMRTLQLRARWLLSDSLSVSPTDEVQIGYQATSRLDAASEISVWADQSDSDPGCTDSLIAAWEQCVTEMFSRDRPTVVSG